MSDQLHFPHLLNLPSDLLRKGPLELLDIRDIIVLNTAILSHRVRSNFLAAARRAVLGVANGQAVEIDKENLLWFVEKEGCVKSANFCGRLTDVDLSESAGILHSLESAKISGCIAITDVGIATLLRECPSLYKLEIFTCFSISPAALRHANGSALRELHVTQCPTIDDATYSELIVECSNLEVIVIEGCAALTDVSVRVASLICTKLREFTFRDNKLLTPQSVAFLAQNCTTLKKIVGGYHGHSVSTDEGHPEFRRVLVDLVKTNPLLEHVELHCPEATSGMLFAFAERCPHLHTFAIGACYNDLGSGISAVIKKCRSLTHLDVSELALNVDTLWAIGAHCKKLKALFLPPINANNFDGELRGILKLNPDLHTLVLEGASNMNGEGFLFDATSNPTASTKELNLTHLDVSECGILQPDNLVSLLARCPKLNRLNLSCNYVDSTILSALGQRCPLLQYLNLTQCPGVNDAALCALAANCTTLTVLLLNACKATDMGLSAIVSRNRSLELLDLSWCSNMRDSTIYAISTHCTKLHTLKLCAANISADAFKAVAKSCTRLRKLVARNCEFITDSCLSTLTLHCRRLEDIYISDSELITTPGLKKFTNDSTRLLRGAVENCVLVTGRGGPAIYFSTS